MRVHAFVVVSLITPPIDLSPSTLRNYGERDKTTAFLENKGPEPLADLGSTKSALRKQQNGGAQTRDQFYYGHGSVLQLHSW